MDKLLFGREPNYFEAMGAGNTAREIAQQPDVWRKLAAYLLEKRDDISTFMDKLAAVDGLRIVFTGAGSSAFIGESMQMLISGESGLRCEAVHTTDIVASPGSTLPDSPTLLISYSRSGESPESVGALQYAAKRVTELYNIVLVCKENSSVAKYAGEASGTLTLNMPPESCDLGFAMTSSVSAMALATWCLFGYRELDDRIAYIRRLADIAEAELSRLDDDARTVAEWEFDRIVYLGSGALKGLAREAAIKMLELTGGIVNSGWDTPAGFRHGPKSVIIGNAVTVHLLSNLPFTRKYDDCLLREVLRQRKANKTVAVAPAFIGAAGADIEVSYTPEEGGSREIYPYILGLLFIQLPALEKSLLLGKSTDNPAPGGEVNRVVQGIEIYPLED